MTLILSNLFAITFVSAQDVVQDSIPVQETKRQERTKTITVGPFTGIKLFSGIQVKLIPSNENKLVLAGENFETVVTTLKNDVLRIKHSIDQIFNPKNTYIEIYFSSPLDLIHTYQGSIVESISDPISLKFKSGGTRATLGARLNLPFIKIFADYTLQEYNTATLGIAFSFR